MCNYVGSQIRNDKLEAGSWKPSTLEVGSQGEKTEAENKELLNRREEKKATSDDEQGI
jgi:hypothetical protein